MAEKRNTELAYIAGIFDGEGCVHIDNALKLRINISNNNTAVLKWIKCLFGGAVYIYATRKNNAQYIISGRSAIAMLKAILPYLRIKREKALKAIEYEKTYTKQRPFPLIMIQNRVELRNHVNFRKTA